jgi:peroxiredoxin
MKILQLFALTLFMLACNAGSKSLEENTVLFSGKITYPVEDGRIFISRYVEGKPTPFDTVTVLSDGSFEHNLIVEEPSVFMVDVFGKQKLNLVLSDEDVVLNADGTEGGTFEFTGSTDSRYLQEISELNKAYREKVSMINNQYRNAQISGDQVTVESLKAKYEEINGEFTTNVKNMIWDMDNSVTAVLSVQFLDLEKNMAFADSLYDRFQNNETRGAIVEAFFNVIENMRVLAVGQPAPEIQLPNPEGEMVSLSSLRGKYVLIDFWAAWCKPCRVENPNVLRVYNKYKDQGFEILGVSLDRTKEQWVQAIEADGLTWKHVSDLKFWQSEAAKKYNISAIPATYLISPEGIIVAKNLRGETLEKKLEEIFI